MIINQPLLHLLVIEEEENSPREIILKDSTYSIGRHSSNTIIIDNRLISRHHATFLKVKYPNNEKEVFWILDGNLEGNRSTNGILVNNKSCLSYELRSGDVIIFAKNIKATYYQHLISDEKLLKNYPYGMNGNSSANQDKKTLDSEKEIDQISESLIARLNSFPELSPYPIIEVDKNGQVTYTNSAALDKFPDLFIKQEAHPTIVGLLTNIQEREGKFFIREVEVQEEIFKQYVHYLADNQFIRSYIVDSPKNQKIQQIEKALKESEERYRAVVRQISEGLLLVDPVAKTILEANLAYCTLTGYIPEEILSLNLYNLVAVDEQVIDHEFQKVIENNQNLIIESLHRHKNGTIINVEVNISLITYQSQQVICLAVRDITERKRSEALLQYQAFHDLLTGLPNRVLFNKILEKALANAKRANKSIAVLFFDLDRFKNINDSLGHPVGDQVLKSLATRLKSSLRSCDTIARWGGDEFIILLSNINHNQDIAKASQRIIDSLKKPFLINNHQLHVTVSIGIAIYPQDGEFAETLIKNADSALYRTKEQGRNSYHFYNPSMSSTTSHLLEVENFLHKALEKNEFLLHYQPQINIRTGQITGMEALIRWKHPELGLVSPSQFIPIAEETGLIIPIGEWVLYQACHQYKTWEKAGLFLEKISVNLSPRQFQHRNIILTIQRLLEETNLDAKFLELEITESLLIGNIDFIHKMLYRLREMGVNLSIDDFGTGYSSLGYLKKFPFHTLKIDQSFVRDLQNNLQDLAIISAIITLGKGFNLKVICEGIENQKQLELLYNLGCENMQGYFFSKPLPAEEATKLLEKQENFKLNISYHQTAAKQIEKNHHSRYINPY